MFQSTLAIIKPDAVARGLTGEILTSFQAGGLVVAGLKMVRLSQEQARAFYAVHKERPFFESLTEYMASGPVVCAVLRGENAVARYRELMGRHGPGQGRARHSASCLWSKLAGQCRAWLRRAGNRGRGNSFFLQFL